MIPLIRARPGIRIPDLASIFGVREAEIWDDIRDVLTMCGVPPYLPHNYFVFSIHDDRVSIHFAEHLARPVHLTLQEALAIDLALRSVSGGHLPSFGEAAPRLRRKLRELLRGAERQALETLDRSVAGEAPPDLVAQTILRLKQAMERNVGARITYYTASRDAVTERTIEPYGLLDHRGHWYVIARDELSGREVSFRVDRIREATLEPEHEYEVPDDFTTEKFRRDEMVAREPSHVPVRVWFAAPAAARAREGAERRAVQSLPEGEIVRTYYVDPARPRWLFTHLARFGADAEVLSPPALRAQMAAFLDAVLVGNGVVTGPVQRTARTAAAVSRPKRPQARRKPRKGPGRSK